MTTTGANTISTTANRNKFRLSVLDSVLTTALVAEKICMVDRSELYTLQSPYITDPTTTVSGLTGTYAIDDYTITASTLTIADEFKVANHVYQFENLISNFDLFSDLALAQARSMAIKLDSFVLNVIGTNATGSYTTPVGGFTTPANFLTILGNLVSKVAGYADTMNGMYLVIENTDLAGVLPAEGSFGFSFSDMALNNGFVKSVLGVDIYVVRTGTFVTSTIGTQSVTMSGCRLFGLKNVCTYAAPRGVEVSEKEVGGATGKEIVTYCVASAKVWAAKAAATVKITLA
jgi:hypothetical protein